MGSALNRARKRWKGKGGRQRREDGSSPAAAEVATAQAAKNREVYRSAGARPSQMDPNSVCPDRVLLQMGEMMVDNGVGVVEARLEALTETVSQYGDVAGKALDEAQRLSSEFVDVADGALKVVRDKRMAFTPECSTIVKDISDLVGLLGSPATAEALARLERLAALMESLSGSAKDGWMEKLLLALMSNEGGNDANNA